MDTVAQSFANLVKTNNGFFKSEAQTKFLLSQSGYEYVSTGIVMRNSFSMHYMCDDRGVTMVRKYTKAKGFVTTWERVIDGVVPAQDVNEIKRLTRLIKSTKTSIANRQVSWDSGKYAVDFHTYEAALTVFNSSMFTERNSLRALTNKLNSLK